MTRKPYEFGGSAWRRNQERREESQDRTNNDRRGLNLFGRRRREAEERRDRGRADATGEARGGWERLSGRVMMSPTQMKTESLRYTGQAGWNRAIQALVAQGHLSGNHANNLSKIQQAVIQIEKREFARGNRRITDVPIDANGNNLPGYTFYGIIGPEVMKVLGISASASTPSSNPYTAQPSSSERPSAPDTSGDFGPSYSPSSPVTGPMPRPDDGGDWSSSFSFTQTPSAGGTDTGGGSPGYRPSSPFAGPTDTGPGGSPAPVAPAEAGPDAPVAPAEAGPETQDPEVLRTFEEVAEKIGNLPSLDTRAQELGQELIPDEKDTRIALLAVLNELAQGVSLDVEGKLIEPEKRAQAEALRTDVLARIHFVESTQELVTKTDEAITNGDIATLEAARTALTAIAGGGTALSQSHFVIWAGEELKHVEAAIDALDEAPAEVEVLRLKIQAGIGTSEIKDILEVRGYERDRDLSDPDSQVELAEDILAIDETLHEKDLSDILDALDLKIESAIDAYEDADNARLREYYEAAGFDPIPTNIKDRGELRKLVLEAMRIQREMGDTGAAVDGLFSHGKIPEYTEISQRFRTLDLMERQSGKFDKIAVLRGYESRELNNATSGDRRELYDDLVAFGADLSGDLDAVISDLGSKKADTIDKYSDMDRADLRKYYEAVGLTDTQVPTGDEKEAANLDKLFKKAIKLERDTEEASDKIDGMLDSSKLDTYREAAERDRMLDALRRTNRSQRAKIREYRGYGATEIDFADEGDREDLYEDLKDAGADLSDDIAKLLTSLETEVAEAADKYQATDNARLREYYLAVGIDPVPSSPKDSAELKTLVVKAMNIQREMGDTGAAVDGLLSYAKIEKYKEITQRRKILEALKTASNFAKLLELRGYRAGDLNKSVEEDREDLYDDLREAGVDLSKDLADIESELAVSKADVIDKYDDMDRGDLRKYYEAVGLSDTDVPGGKEKEPANLEKLFAKAIKLERDTEEDPDKIDGMLDSGKLDTYREAAQREAILNEMETIAAGKFDNILVLRGYESGELDQTIEEDREELYDDLKEAGLDLTEDLDEVLKKLKQDKADVIDEYDRKDRSELRKYYEAVGLSDTDVPGGKEKEARNLERLFNKAIKLERDTEEDPDKIDGRLDDGKLDTYREAAQREAILSEMETMTATKFNEILLLRGYEAGDLDRTVEEDRDELYDDLKEAGLDLTEDLAEITRELKAKKADAIDDYDDMTRAELRKYYEAVGITDTDVPAGDEKKPANLEKLFNKAIKAERLLGEDADDVDGMLKESLINAYESGSRTVEFIGEDYPENITSIELVPGDFDNVDADYLDKLKDGREVLDLSSFPLLTEVDITSLEVMYVILPQSVRSVEGSTSLKPALLQETGRSPDKYSLFTAATGSENFFIRAAEEEHDDLFDEYAEDTLRHGGQEWVDTIKEAVGINQDVFDRVYRVQEGQYSPKALRWQFDGDGRNLLMYLLENRKFSLAEEVIQHGKVGRGAIDDTVRNYLFDDGTASQSAYSIAVAKGASTAIQDSLKVGGAAPTTPYPVTPAGRTTSAAR